MTDIVRLMAILGRIPPEAWDAIVPQGPVEGSWVELNPQPLPPGATLFLVASATAGQAIAQATVVAEATRAGNPEQIVSDAVDEWCGTKGPFPWPHPWPLPWSADTESPGDLDVPGSRVVGALSMASVASRLLDGEARRALSVGAERLLEAGLAS